MPTERGGREQPERVARDVVLFLCAALETLLLFLGAQVVDRLKTLDERQQALAREVSASEATIAGLRDRVLILERQVSK